MKRTFVVICMAVLFFFTLFRITISAQTTPTWVAKTYPKISPTPGLPFPHEEILLPGKGWVPVTLPDVNFGCGGCEKFFATVVNGQPASFTFKYAADNTAGLYINGKLVFDHNGTFGKPDFCTGKPCCTDCCDGPDHCVQIVNQQNWFSVPRTYFETGKNIVIWRVRQDGGGSGFHCQLNISGTEIIKPPSKNEDKDNKNTSDKFEDAIKSWTGSARSLSRSLGHVHDTNRTGDNFVVYAQQSRTYSLYIPDEGEVIRVIVKAGHLPPTRGLIGIAVFGPDKTLLIKASPIQNEMDTIWGWKKEILIRKKGLYYFMIYAEATNQCVLTVETKLGTSFSTAEYYPRYWQGKPWGLEGTLQGDLPQGEGRWFLVGKPWHPNNILGNRQYKGGQIGTGSMRLTLKHYGKPLTVRIGLLDHRGGVEFIGSVVSGTDRETVLYYADFDRRGVGSNISDLFIKVYSINGQSGGRFEVKMEHSPNKKLP